MRVTTEKEKAKTNKISVEIQRKTRQAGLALNPDSIMKIISLNKLMRLKELRTKSLQDLKRNYKIRKVSVLRR